MKIDESVDIKDDIEFGFDEDEDEDDDELT